jgi:putative SOS response-associated peptidase YedK
MCYQTKITKKREKLEEYFKAKLLDLDDFVPSDEFKAFDFPKTPVITHADPKQIQLYQWGLVPNWADSNWNRNYTLNARIETLDQKKSFKSITDNRCLVLVNGFYEWQHINNSKIKYEIGFNDELFALAGLYDKNEEINTYTIITTEAKGIMCDIHNTKLRMPFAIKDLSDMHAWLHGDDIKPDFNFTSSPNLYKQQSLF